MYKQNHFAWQNEMEKKAEKKEKRKRKSMKVSGASVKNLQKIIKEKV